MKRISVEIADTPTRRALGLMDRKILSENSGMLFKFPHKDYLNFWMKKTYIPLDIAFIDDNGEILQIEAMSPLCTKAISAKYPCRYALEVNRGWFDKNDIGIGDKIGGLDICKRGISRLAQMTPQTIPPSQQMPGQIPSDMPPNVEIPGQQGQQKQIDTQAEVVLDDHAKVRYADEHNLVMQIVYQSKQSGQTLPPRKLIPVPGEGYPIRVGDGGEYFVAYDASPTINGGDWQILGNQIKRFLFANIIALEVLEEFAK